MIGRWPWQRLPLRNDWERWRTSRPGVLSGVRKCTGPCQRWMWGLYWPIMHVSASFVSSPFSLSAWTEVPVFSCHGLLDELVQSVSPWYGRRPSLGLADVCGGGKGGEMHGPVGGVIRYLLSSSYLPCHGPCMTGSFDRAIRHDSLYMLVGTELYS
jgi:hypothetical protein